jgi:hypothetical protein
MQVLLGISILLLTFFYITDATNISAAPGLKPKSPFWKSRNRSFSFLEMMVCYFSFLFYPAYAIPAALYILDLNFPLLTISGLAAESRGPLMILICCSLDTALFATVIIWGSYTFFMALAFVLAFLKATDGALLQIK